MSLCGFAVLTFVHAAMGAMKTYELQGNDFVPSKSAKPQGFLDRSPFEKMTYKPYDMCALRNFGCVATVHYNFLDNVAKDELDKYNFGTWDLNAFSYERWSINTIMFKGSDLNREDISEDDEQSISETLPKSKGRHCGVCLIVIKQESRKLVRSCQDPAWQQHMLRSAASRVV